MIISHQKYVLAFQIFIVNGHLDQLVLVDVIIFSGFYIINYLYKIHLFRDKMLRTYFVALSQCDVSILCRICYVVTQTTFSVKRRGIISDLAYMFGRMMAVFDILRIFGLDPHING